VGGQRRTWLNTSATPLAAASVRIELVNGALPIDDLILVPNLRFALMYVDLGNLPAFSSL
jgi:hypothetical protein